MSYVACVASVAVWFRSKERPRNGILGFGRARNVSLTLVPRSLLLNRTETLTTQAMSYPLTRGVTHPLTRGVRGLEGGDE